MVGEHGLFGPATTQIATVVASQPAIVVALDRAVCHTARLRTNAAMAALQRHMLRVMARRLITMDGNRARIEADPTAGAVAPNAPSRRPNSAPVHRLRRIFGGSR